MERPQVVVTDPRDPQPSGDVLEADGSPHGSRRLVVGVVGLVGVLLAAQVVSQVRERRAADAAERRAQATVALEPVLRFEQGLSQEYEPGRDLARVRYSVGVRNTGPREVRVVEGSLGDLRLEGEVVVPVGAERRVVLSSEVGCATRPSAGSPATLARLVVLRADGGQSPYEVATALDGEQLRLAAARACRYLDPVEALFVEAVSAEPGDGLVDARFVLRSVSRGPVEVTGVTVASGLTAELRDEDGRPLALPLVVPVEDPATGGDGRLVVVRLRVADCALVREPSDDPFDAAAPSVVVLDLTGDGDEEGGILVQVSDLLAVPQLLERAC